jgi:UDP-glucose 4-epimerase
VTQDKVLVTGTSGRLGRAVLAELSSAGYVVVAADRVSPGSTPEGVESISWDGRDVDALVAAMSGCTGLIHLAAIPHPYAHPDEIVFGNNTTATFAALQAASRSGVTRAVIASSGSAYGSAWSPRPTRARYVPVDEDHPMLNHDAYGLSKEVDERTAEMFSRRDEMTIAALRFHWIATRDEQLQRIESVRAASRRDEVDWPGVLRNLWGYVDLRDAARACRLALEVARDRPYGFAAMNIVAADALSEDPITDLLTEHAPDIEIRAELEPAAGAFAIDRARRVIGWTPRYSWRSVAPTDITGTPGS